MELGPQFLGFNKGFQQCKHQIQLESHSKKKKKKYDIVSEVFFSVSELSKITDNWVCLKSLNDKFLFSFSELSWIPVAVIEWYKAVWKLWSQKKNVYDVFAE